MATIRERGGKYQAVVRRKGYPELLQTFELRKDAEKWARQQEALMDSEQWVDRTSANQTTLKELLDRYAKEVIPSKRGARAELHRIGQFKEHKLSVYMVAAITPQMVAQWRDERLKAVSSGTVLRELCLLSHVFSVAIRDWGVALNANPVKMIRKPPQGRARDRVLTDDERDRLIAECRKCRNPWVYPVVLFALETGARRGEILALDWKGMNLKSRTAKLLVTKTDVPRTIPLSPACLAMLEKLPRCIEGRVFPISVEALKQAYERAVKRAGIEDWRFHDLRHDALTRLAKRGLSILELRAISGHATVQMLNCYVSISSEELARKL